MSERARFTCRPYRPGDEERIAALFERVFERPMTARQWMWKLGNHDGTVPNVWLAVDRNDRPICHYAGMARRLRWGDEDHAVMVAVDGMTAPEFRRQGAFTAVVAHAHEAWRDAGVACVLGLPNEQSRFEGLGWQELSSLRWMIRPLRPDVLLRRRSRLGATPGIGTAAAVWNRFWDRGTTPPGLLIDSAGETAARSAFSRVPEWTPTDNRFILARDPRWMAHRLLEAPDTKHRIMVAEDGQQAKGMIAYRLQEISDRRIGAIVELAGTNDGVCGSLLREVSRRLRAEGAEMAISLSIAGTPEFRLLRRHGFLFSWGAFAVCAVVLDPRIDTARLRGSPWMLSGGDFDVI